MTDRFRPNQIIQADAGHIPLPNDCVDLTVTSPPYDKMREYKGFNFNYVLVARELRRVTRPGGRVVWVVGDETKEGTESLTSFRHALCFQSEDFKVETMIYTKGGEGATGSNDYYWQDFEYMFVFTKKGGQETFNPIEDRKNVAVAKTKFATRGHRSADGGKRELGWVTLKEYGRRMNVWEYHAARAQQMSHHDHPAQFPEALARDHILSWSNPGDLVLDPMSGSGTTCKAAKELGRNYFGFDIAIEYVTMSRERLANTVPALFT